MDSWRRRYEVRHDAFDVLDERAAYWVGFIFADGHVSARKRYVAVRLTASDRQHLEKLRAFLGSTHPIEESPAGNYGGYHSRPSCRLSVWSTVVVSRLLELGRYEGELPPMLTQSRDFWRGIVDGDGSLGTTKRGHTHFGVVGSRRVTDAFLVFLKEHEAGARMTVRPKKSIFEVATAGHTATRIIDILYRGCPSSAALTRKATIAARILAVDDLRCKQLDDAVAARAERIRQWYAAGESLAQIADRLGVSNVSVLRWMKEAGIPRRPRVGGRTRQHVSAGANL